MGPNRQPKWLKHETIKAADTELAEALKANPFVGPIAIEALANFIRATNDVRTASNGKVSLTDTNAAIAERVGAARAAAEAVPDPTYAQIFSAQEQGWAAAARIAEAAPVVPEEPTSTEGKSMGDGKGKRAS